MHLCWNGGMSDTKRTGRLNPPASADGFLVLVEAQDFAFVNPWLEPAQLSTQHRARLSHPSCELTQQYKR